MYVQCKFIDKHSKTITFQNNIEQSNDNKQFVTSIKYQPRHQQHKCRKRELHYEKVQLY